MVQRRTLLQAPELAPASPGSQEQHPISQLKHVIKAQHGKIEELREQLRLAEGPGLTSSVHEALRAQEASDVSHLKRENDEYRRSLNALKEQLSSSRRETETLRKVNKRLKSMLEQGGVAVPESLRSTARPSTCGDGPAAKLMASSAPGPWQPAATPSGVRELPSTAPASARTARFTVTEKHATHAFLDFQHQEDEDVDDFGMTLTPEQAKAMSARDHRSSPTRHTFALPSHSKAVDMEVLKRKSDPSALRATSPRISMKRGTAFGRFASMPLKHDAAQSSGPRPSPVNRLSRLISCFHHFLQDLESPHAALKALGEVANRVIAEKNVTLTIFVVEPWLRLAVEEVADKKLAVYYVSKGDVELCAVSNSSGSGKTEPPQFSDLKSLPLRTRTAIAAVVPRAGNRAGKPYAVVQATLDKEGDASGRRPSRAGRMGSIASVGSDSDDDSAHLVDPRQTESEEAFAFTDHHISWVQVVCNISGIHLANCEQTAENEQVCDKLKNCIETSVNLLKAKSLRDYEQRLKGLFTAFFSVACVRLLFFDPADPTKLWISASQMKSAEPKAQSIEKGICGLCARQLAVQHIRVIASHPYLDNAADGMQRAGRAPNFKGSMLCGPLMVESDQYKDPGHGNKLLGVIQIFDRKGNSGHFSREDIQFFTQLLKTCTQSLLHALKLQREEIAAKIAPGVTLTLAHMLAA